MAKLIKRGDEEICTRYRPHRFSEVVGNDIAKNGLTRALELGNKRQKSYGFFGTAGSGKTTLARIFAMGLNCEHGDTGEPCLECPSCKSILDDNAMHVIEMNMAQLNKKEDAEQLVNDMGLSVFTGRNKIYILDEVHMVTTQAQNLLLKRLEEPPPDTYFLLCTTDPKKLIDAVQSRLEKYTIIPPSETQVKEALWQIWAQEDYEKRGWKFGPDEWKAFANCIQDMSFREILKTWDQVIRSGTDVVTNIEKIEKAKEKLPQLIMAGNTTDALKELRLLVTNDAMSTSEGLRMQVIAYLKGCCFSVKNPPGPQQMEMFLKILMCFSEPIYDNDKEPKLRMMKSVYDATKIAKELKR